ncbi:PAS domain S-box protein [Microcoleus sp. D2_18a_D3]|uniref:PAS domain S-box protein n=1 Tax=Microcoleus sp. D2_18a_D3 TaxID=3055330 RepID=UPI002FD77D72
MIEHTDENNGKLQQQQQEILAKIALSLSEFLKLEDILNTTVTELRNILQCDRVIIFQFAPDWSGKVLVESVGSEWTAILSTQIHDPCVGENYIEPFKQGLFTSKSDIYTAQIDTCHREFLTTFQVRANLVIPILKGEELWGLLIAHHCAAPREWQPSEIELMRQVATQAGIAIQQADLFPQVQTEQRERQPAGISLQQLHTELEQPGIERTRELTEVNESLQHYITQVEDLYNNAPCGYHSLDAAGTIIMINDTELKWLGYTRDEIVHQKKFVDLITVESKDIFEQNFPLFKKQGYIHDLEFQMLNKNGKPIWVNLNATAIYDEAGNFMMSRSSIFDITHHKRAEEAFRQYERIVFNTTDGIVLMDRNYIYQIVNQAYLNWCNKSESEVIGNSVRNILDADVFDNMIKPRLDRCLAGEKIQYENWFDSPNFVRQFLSVTYIPLRDAGENIVGVIVSLRDLTKLKQAEQMLELQAVITRNMAEGICLVRADNAAIVYANPKFERMFGYDSGELNGQHVSILNYGSASVSPEDVNQAIRSAVLQNSEFSYEVHNVKKDGTPFWCSATCSVFNHSEYGDVLVAVHQDITVAKHLEEVRQEAEAALLQKSRKENLLWRITQGIRQSLDLNAVLNTAVTEIRQTLQTDRTTIYRFNPDWSGDFVVESVGEDWRKLIGSDIQQNCADTYLQETHGGRFRNHENFVVNNIYSAELQPCHIELVEQFQAKSYAVFPIFLRENLWGLLAIYQNTAPRQWQSWEIELLEQIASQLSIAIQQSKLYQQLHLELQERKQAEAVLREAERRWRSLLDNVQLIVVGLDIRGNVNYVNPFFLQLTGYTHPEVIGKSWFKELLPCSIQQSIKVVFSEVLAQKYHVYYQNPILTKAGEERFIAWNNTVLQDSEGNIIGTISIGEDITERQKLEHIKNEFIGIVSHELRTPLTGIQMSLGLIKSGVYDKKPEKSRRMIEIALLDTNRLVNLVNDILDLERLDSGRAILEKTVCKAADLMQQAVDSTQAIAIQQQISLIVTPTDAEVWATGDAIVQTLTNLLSNAIKFSPAYSTIHLSAENQTDFVLFQVSDRGRGIPADKLELIFGRFQQVDASDSREKGGTGLGLPICRSIVEQHGGKIWAESILGEGSTFCFTLPLATIEEP